MAKRTVPKAESQPGAASMRDPRVDEVIYRLHTLLHTMRAIERREEAICGLLSSVERSGKVTLKQDEELRDLLEEMPCHEYGEDVDAVRRSLTPALHENTP